MKGRRFFAAVALAAALGAACGGASGEEGGATLTAADFKFDPTSLTVAAGESIEFSNEDDAEHNFMAKDAGVDEDVEAGESTTIDLADVDPGSYDFLCKYHPKEMTGTLEVTE